MRTIPVRGGELALVDDADYERLSRYRWKRARGYLRATVTSDNPRHPRHIWMHREVLGDKPGHQVDHRDRDILNNQRDNLRHCTNAQNAQNRGPRAHSSRYRGVTWNRKSTCWQAGIRANGVTKYLGLFAVEEDAASAYDTAARELHGEFANPNFSEVCA